MHRDRKIEGREEEIREIQRYTETGSLGRKRERGHRETDQIRQRDEDE